MSRFLAVCFCVCGLSGSEWFVDSSRGDDANPGTSADSAFRSIARLRGEAMPEGVIINLARGSYWREELRGLPRRAVVRAYGEGARPILDAADEVPFEAIKTIPGGLHRVRWDHQITEPDKGRLSVWEDGVRLRRMPTREEVEARPGSFFATLPIPGETAEIWIHPTGASMHTYEVSRRESGLVLPDGGQAYGIHTRRNGHNNGSLIGGYGVFLKDSLAEDGTVHNVLIASGVVEDVVAWKHEIDPGWGSSTMFVSYAPGAAGLGVIYRRAKALGGDPARPDETGGAVGFFQHAGPNGPDYAFVLYEDCEATGVAIAFGGVAEHVIITGGRVSRARRAVRAEALVDTYIVGLTVDGDDDAITLDRVVDGPSPRTNIYALNATSRSSSGALVWLNGEIDIAQTDLRFVNRTPAPAVGVRVDSGRLRLRSVNIDGADTPVELGSEASIQ